MTGKAEQICAAKCLHVTIFDIFQGVLERTVRFFALIIFSKKPASRHPLFIKLMEEAAVVSFHAKPTQPVSTNRLCPTEVK